MQSASDAPSAEKPAPPAWASNAAWSVYRSVTKNVFGSFAERCSTYCSVPGSSCRAGKNWSNAARSVSAWPSLTTIVAMTETGPIRPVRRGRAPPGARREVEVHLGAVQHEPVQVDHVEVRPLADLERAAVVQPVQRGGVARHLADHDLDGEPRP